MKTALVTGASRGLGAATAKALARAGYAVAVNYLSQDEAAQAVVRDLGADAFAVRADIGDPKQVRAMVGEIGERWGRLDVLVNNAGLTRDSLLIKLPEEDWDRVVGVNLSGPFHVLRTVVPLMERPGGGHVVNIASRSGTKGKAGQAAYAASKAGLVGFTMTAARELGASNIRVNAVLPGYMPTDMGSEAEAAMEAARAHSALGRLSDPGESASFIVWLVGTEGITGRVFDLDSRVENTPL
jgi:3-oxoacyl-[acyl-carrier protein] reductase